MRVALVLIAALAFTGEARADVFVPADPPAGVECAAADGDVIAVMRDKRLLVSVAGAPWVDLGDRCASQIVAAGDTAAIDAGGLRVGTGGTFRAPLPIGDSASVAVAPGGWAVAAWLEEDERISALLVRPDGSSARAVLDRRPRDGRLAAPRVGIDAAGNAIVAWTHWGHPIRMRTARAVFGGPLRPAADLPGTPLSEAPGVAVTPAGRTLIAWADEDGVLAAVDGEPLVTVDPDETPNTVTAALREDGTAVIAYAAYAGAVSAVDRAAGGAWSAPHVLSGRFPVPLPADDDFTPALPTQALALAPDRRAVVAWSAGVGFGSVVAASGRAGGRWGPATPLSASFRRAGFPAVTLDAAATPRVLWHEDQVGERGAAPVVSAPLDTTPPRFSARIPARLPPTRTGDVEVRVRVSCPEGCEATLRLAYDNVAGRTLAPGEAATLKVPTGGSYYLMPRNSRRIRVELLVGDRAGNLVRRVRTVQVRIAVRPLRAYKVPADTSFSMFSDAGDRAVARLVNELIEALASGEIRSLRALQERYDAGLRVLDAAGFDEYGDTEVREDLFGALDIPLAVAGYNAESVISR